MSVYYYACSDGNNAKIDTSTGVAVIYPQETSFSGPCTLMGMEMIPIPLERLRENSDFTRISDVKIVNGVLANSVWLAIRLSAGDVVFFKRVD
jgi:hypothetical protein